MAKISSETLFNFTDSLEHLIDNLENGIYCHPSYEKLPERNNGYRVAMACFCDIPLSLIKEHFDWYGRYGIGLNKRFAREEGVKPVWYIASESKLIKGLKSRTLAHHEKHHILPFLKQYMGYQDLNGESKRKKFYNEREWRYIPPGTQIEPAFGSNEKKRIENLNMDSKRMEIDLEKIEYLIVKGPKDIDPILKVLKNLSTKRNIDYESLVSKILTSRMIDRDF